MAPVRLSVMSGTWCWAPRPSWLLCTFQFTWYFRHYVALWLFFNQIWVKFGTVFHKICWVIVSFMKMGALKAVLHWEVLMNICLYFPQNAQFGWNLLWDLHIMLFRNCGFCEGGCSESCTFLVGVIKLYLHMYCRTVWNFESKDCHRVFSTSSWSTQFAVLLSM
jgi:hypothetical protein